MFHSTSRRTTTLALLVLAAALTACSHSNPTGSDLSPSTRGSVSSLTPEIEFASRVATTDPASRTLTFTTSSEIAVAATDAEIVRKDGGVETPILFDEIQVGDSVEVRGDRQSDGTILADRIRVRVGDDNDGDFEFHSVITGISLIDSTLTVRDRSETIHVTAATRILGRISGGASVEAAHDGDDDQDNSGHDDSRDTTIAFEALAVGDSVEVHALIIDAANLQATEVELEDGADDNDPNEVEFKDTLGSVAAASRTVTFNNQTWIGIVDENADLQNLSNMPVDLDAFMAGQLVEVRGSAGTGDTLWINRMHMDNN